MCSILKGISSSLHGQLHVLPDLGDNPDLDLRMVINRFAILRRDVYDKMGQSIQNGLVLGGVITQGLTQDDLFVTRRDARSGQIHIEPVSADHVLGKHA